MMTKTESLTLTTVASDRFFFASMASVILFTVLVAFSGSYYHRVLTAEPPMSALVHWHAFVFTLWVLLFFTQTTLVAAGRVDWHRRLGKAGASLVGLMIVLGYAVAVNGARHGHGAGGAFPDALAFLAVTLTDIALFAGFVTAALYYRRQRELHQRLMLLATIGGLLWPAITRLPFVRGKFPLMFGLVVLFVLAGPAYELATRRRVHPVYLWGGLLILASFPLRRALALSQPWHEFAAWLIR